MWLYLFLFFSIKFPFVTYKVDSLDNCENVLFDKTVNWLLLKSLKKKKKTKRY